MRRTQRTRADAHLPLWLPWLILGACFCCTVAPATTEDPESTAVAVRFATLFLEGQDEQIQGMMTPEMKSGLGGGQAEQIRAVWTAQFGAVGSVGAAWNEDLVQGFRRYRVPVEFEKATRDLRVVLDGQGRVAGLFIVPHVPPPAERGDASPPGPELEVAVGSGETALPGTLSLPEGPGPFPGIVLVHGSGPNDRDESIGPNKPFRDIAWGLARRGVAVLRYDKRSFARKEDLLAVGQALTVQHEVIDDARAALALLRGHEQIEKDRVYLLGHSLGGTLAPRIADTSPRPAGIVILAGAVDALLEKILTQYRYIFSLDGTVSEKEQQTLDQTEAVVRSIRDALDGTAEPPDGYVLGAPFGYFKDLERHDPPAEAAALGLPTLVLQGRRDYQVTLDEFERWRSALAGKPGACLMAYEGLDHLFREGSGPPGPHDYERLAPVEPRVIDDIAAWIDDGRCGREAPDGG